MELKTVNVIAQGECINAIQSFTDDAEGNVQAETVFREYAEDNGLDSEEIEIALDDGWFQKDTFICTIIHSS